MCRSATCLLPVHSVCSSTPAMLLKIPVSYVQPSALVVCAVGGAGDLSIPLHSRHPSFYIIFAVGRSPQVTSRHILRTTHMQHASHTILAVSCQSHMTLNISRRMPETTCRCMSSFALPPSKLLQRRRVGLCYCLDCFGRLYMTLTLGSVACTTCSVVCM